MAAAIVAVLCLLSITSPAVAGTICGTIRDENTSAPVARAGIFVRTQAGAYTGYHGATDETGRFCIDEIPAGTYDLEVTVDNYRTRYLRGIVVTDETTDVDIDIWGLEHFLAAPWPNPAQTSVNFRYSIGVPVPVKLEVYDVRGRLVRGWQDTAPVTGVHDFSWDLRARDGSRISSGVYYVRFSAGNFDNIRQVIVLR